MVPDIYLTTRDAPAVPDAPPARLLRSADAPALEAVRGAFAAIDPAMGHPFKVGAAAFADDRIVSIAAITAMTPRYANISVATLPEWRDRGHATAAAAILTAGIAATKRIALWSCSETNGPSLAIARGLGFEEVTQRTFLVRE
ncbi:MAG: GNAT family N-acetyltransferase [Thermomicrobiales bacterium]